LVKYYSLLPYICYNEVARKTNPSESDESEGNCADVELILDNLDLIQLARPQYVQTGLVCSLTQISGGFDRDSNE
jgi:hypothetical protein